jgi:hypothetical protein
MKSYGQRRWEQYGYVFIAVVELHGERQQVVFDDRNDFDHLRKVGLLNIGHWLYGYTVRSK